MRELFTNLLHKIVFKMFMHMSHKSFVFDIEVNVYAFVTQEFCLWYWGKYLWICYTRLSLNCLCIGYTRVLSLIMRELFMNLLHKIVFKLFMHWLHKSVVFDNKGIVYEFVTTEFCLFKLFMNLLHSCLFKLFMHLLQECCLW
jgi:hypothetical protein